MKNDQQDTQWIKVFGRAPVLTILKLLGALLFLLIGISGSLRGGDFDVFLDAARKLKDGMNIYEPPFLHERQYFYSPFFAVILVPFAGNFLATKIIWTCLSLVLSVRIWYLVHGYLKEFRLTPRERTAVNLLALFLIIRFLIPNISLVQVNIFMIWACLESYHLTTKGKTVMGALVLAFAINIKIIPVVMIPFLLYRGYFRVHVYIVAFTLLFLFLPSIPLGYDQNVKMISDWWGVINPMNKEFLIESDINAQSLAGMIPVFLTDTTGEMELRRNILHLTPGSAASVMNLIRALFICSAVYFLGRPFKKSASPLEDLYGLSYIIMMIPLVFPHQQKYAFIALFPAITYLLYYLYIRMKSGRSLSLTLQIGMFSIAGLILSPLVGADILGRWLYDLVHHYRFLTFATISLVILLAIARPWKLEGTSANHKFPDHGTVT